MKSRIINKAFAVLAAAAIAVPVVSYSCMPVSAAINLYDTWAVTSAVEQSCLPNNVQRAFDEAMQSYDGLPLTPIAYYGIQVVAGYNYALICRENNSSLKKVTIYDPNAPGMNGHRTARIGHIEDFNMEDYDESYYYRLPSYPAPGSMEIADDMSGFGLPDHVQEVYDKFFNNYDGMGCRPLAFLAEKHNDEGVDYAILGEFYAVVPDPDRFIEVAVFHEDNDGNVHIKSQYMLLGKRGTDVVEFTNYSYLSAAHIGFGNTLTVYADADGGDGSYTYAVLYKKKSDKKWTVKQNYSTNNVITIKPAKATDYDVCVKVKDGTGKIVKKFDEFSVNPRLTNTSTISATTICKGESVTLTGSATGGVGVYDYAVLYKKKSDTKWTVRQGYKENNQITVKPYTNTEYNVCIKVKDLEGTISKKYFTVNVK